MARSWQSVKHWLRTLEDRWFDRSRHVRTSGQAVSIDPGGVAGEVRDSLPYIPVRVRRARAALRAAPVADHARYTFVDLGSGEGRVLFVAAELPFKRIVGVEFVGELHARAEANVQTFRHRATRCADLRPIHADAASFEFPPGHLVVYVFNSFGPQVLRAVLIRLEEALAREGRHVVVLMQWPVLGHLVGETPGFEAVKIAPQLHVYQADSRGDASRQ